MTHSVTYRTPRGNPINLYIRSDTNDDALAHAILVADEYGLRDTRVTGWALDVGAHIGTVGIALALDNPEARVVLIEPVPSNADLIRRSIALNGLTDRVFLEEAGAGKKGQATTPCSFGYSKADGYDAHYVHDSRFVGNVIRAPSKPDGEMIDVPVVTLAALAAKYGPFDYMKIDCEGCEWQFLASKPTQADVIVGEWHDAQFAAIDALLGGTHVVTMVEDKGGVGLFRAKRREPSPVHLSPEKRLARRKAAEA